MSVSPDGTRLALTYKPKARGQPDLAVLDLATGTVRPLTTEADPQWSWTPIAWIEGGRALIANRYFTDSSASEIWRVDAATGRGTRLLAKPKTRYVATDATAARSRLRRTRERGSCMPGRTRRV